MCAGEDGEATTVGGRVNADADFQVCEYGMDLADCGCRPCTGAATSGAAPAPAREESDSSSNRAINVEWFGSLGEDSGCAFSSRELKLTGKKCSVS